MKERECSACNGKFNAGQISEWTKCPQCGEDIGPDCPMCGEPNQELFSCGSCGRMLGQCCAVGGWCFDCECMVNEDEEDYK